MTRIASISNITHNFAQTALTSACCNRRFRKGNRPLSNRSLRRRNKYASHGISYPRSQPQNLSGIPTKSFFHNRLNCLFFSLLLFVAAVCDPPPNIENGDYSCDRKLKLGSVCKYHCSSGYLLRPSNHTGLLCYKNSVWVGSRLPVCLLGSCNSFYA